MRAVDKLRKYEERLRAWKKADENNDPTVHKPTLEECELRNQVEVWAAKSIEERVLGR